MEYIFEDDLNKHLEELRKYIRPIGPKEHPFLTKKGGVREVDFAISEDGQWVLPSTEKGLSFCTSLKQFRIVKKFKQAIFQEIDIYAIDDMTQLPTNMRIVRDRPGHASLIVTQKMPQTDLIAGQSLLVTRAEHIGRIRIKP